jgi:phenylacetic acid degradation operon negative regulatory protein
MKPATEEFLYILLWTADTLMRPTWCNLNGGFEGWAWRRGLGRRIAELEKQQLVERPPLELAHAVVRLTNAGRLAALGGRDPEQQWNRQWDGRWRMVLFDLPEHELSLRMRLWRNLRRHAFGFLQNSVWITPDPVDRKRVGDAAKLPDVEVIIVIEGQPCCGESNRDIVRGAWDFDEINAAYQHCLAILKAMPARGSPTSQIRRWASLERMAWKRAVSLDPFLPAPLLPDGYLGRRVWECRKTALAHRVETLG